jgi:hypothetical protein
VFSKEDELDEFMCDWHFAAPPVPSVPKPDAPAATASDKVPGLPDAQTQTVVAKPAPQPDPADVARKNLRSAVGELASASPSLLSVLHQLASAEATAGAGAKDPPQCARKACT